MSDSYKITRLTDCKWVNLFDVRYERSAQPEKSWIMCSRKDNPAGNADKADAVVIIATIETGEGRKLVVTKEFRVPIWDYEYGFPAGLIDDGEDVEQTVSRELKEETGLELVRIKHISSPVYSSAGLSDESCHMVLVEARGEVSNEGLEDSEDIEVLLLDVLGVEALLASDKKIAAKAWGLLHHYVISGKID